MRLKGIGPEFATVLYLEGYSASLGTDGSWRPMPAWLQSMEEWQHRPRTGYLEGR